jgi:hypothetical protein
MNTSNHSRSIRLRDRGVVAADLALRAGVLSTQEQSRMLLAIAGTAAGILAVAGASRLERSNWAR